MNPVTERLFFALWPPAELADQVAAETRSRLAPLAPGLRLTATLELHVTLLFLGDVEGALRERLQADLEKRPLCGPAGLEIRGPGAFPGRGREATLWFGIHELPASMNRLRELHEDLHDVVSGAGWRPAGRMERVAFRPHLTVCRRRRKSALADLDSFYASGLNLRWDPTELVLMRSNTAARKELSEPRFEVILRRALDCGDEA